MKISVIDGHQPSQTGFVTRIVEVTVELLAKTICQTLWAPGTFNLITFKDKYGNERTGYHRTNENLASISFLTLDIDGGLKLTEAIPRLKKFGYRAIVGLTRNHQKIKVTSSGQKKPACDRFRIILFLSMPLTNDADYKATWQTVKDKFPEMDNCKDSARYFYPCTKVVAIIDGEDYPILPASQSKALPRPLVEVGSTKERGILSRRTRDFLALGPLGSEAWHFQFIRAAFDFKEQLYTFEEAREQLKKAATNAQKDLDETDIQQLKDVYENRLTKFSPRLPSNKGSFSEEYRGPAEAADLELDDAALYGIAGEVVREILPHTEASAAAILFQFLVAFGNLIGRTAHFRVEADRHYLNLFTVLVGQSSKGRKGTSWGYIERIFSLVQEDWVKKCIVQGASSGEGLVWVVRDPIFKIPVSNSKEEGIQLEPIMVDSGVTDKRLLIREGEFAQVLKVARREGNTLSPLLRNAWDSGNLRTLVKNNPAMATGAHLSLIGHVTQEELLRSLTDTEICNGLANRFLWVSVKRSKLLPEGGAVDEDKLKKLAVRIKAIAENVIAHGELSIPRSEGSRVIWREVYPSLSRERSGLLGSILGRAEAQVARLSLIYAVLDRALLIEIPHLEAALAAWKYCEQSCSAIFGTKLGDPTADTILIALEDRSDGMTRSDVSNLFKHNKPSAEIERAIAVLRSLNRIKIEMEATGGRSAERIFLNTDEINEISRN